MPTFTFTSPDGKTYDVQGPEGSTQEQAFSILQKQINIPQKPEPLGFFGGIKEAITGERRATTETQTLPEWTTMPELNQLSMASAKTGLGTLLSSPEETVKIIKANFPDIQVRQDVKGNYIMRSSLNNQEYAIPPGFSTGDIPRALGGIAAFTPAGRATTIPSAAAASAGTQAAIEASQAATGGEFGLPEVGLAAGAGALAPPIAALATKAGQQIPKVVEAIRGVPQQKAEQFASIGGAATSQESMRRTTAEGLPIPLTGPTALTKGQASRDFAQLQFEKESAKLGELGAPLRERAENQGAALIQNFDALIDKTGPITNDLRKIGSSVSDAIAAKAAAMDKKIKTAYETARKAGEMSDPVSMESLSSRLIDLNRYESLSPNIAASRKEAQRLGAIIVDDAGNIQPGSMSLENAELLRQYVNNATDWTNRREALFGRQIKTAIDDATKNSGGNLYKEARKLRTQYADEFENVGLTAKLLGTKGNTTERQIAVEDVFDKVIRLSPIDEVNKLRRTLLTAGPEGKQAWINMKAKGIEYIKESSLSASQKDSRGNPLLSVDKLNRTIKSFDADGKLDALYGKKNAQVIRDLGEIASVINTAPPGAINYSNTASALQVALDSAASYGLTGIPAPIATVLKESAKYLKNRKVKARIADALKER